MTIDTKNMENNKNATEKVKNDKVCCSIFNPDEGFKTAIHTGNLLHIMAPSVTENALKKSGFKNHELLNSLKYLTKNHDNFNHLSIINSMSNMTIKDSNEKLLDSACIDNNNNPQNFDHSKNIKIDPCKISKDNPIMVSLKLFLSCQTPPSSIPRYVEAFQKMFIKTVIKQERASCSDYKSYRRMSDATSESNEDIKSDSSNSKIYEKFKIDMLILSLSKNVKNYCNTNEYIYPYYEALEKLVLSKRVKNIGMSDISIHHLENLEDTVKVKPSIVQIKYTSTNVLEEYKDLIKYSEQKDILLLTHTDEVPFLTSKNLNSVIEKDSKLKTINEDESTKTPNIDNINAVLRYKLTSKVHSVLLGKGYFIFED